MKKELKIVFEQLAEITNKPTSKEQAIQMGLDRYLELEYNSVYGGYRLVQVKVEGGGHSNALNGAFSCTSERVNAKAMTEKIRYFMAGIEYNIKTKQNETI